MKIIKNRPALWVPTLYMAEGIPYVIVTAVVIVMYSRLGLSNGEIALYTSWLYLPWVIKPFWSPLVDAFRTERWWILTMQWLLAISFAGIAFTLQTSHFVQWSLAILWLVAFSSATHDIAADGFYIRALDSKTQAFYVGIRSTAYRIASIVGQGLFIMIAGFLESRFIPSMAWSFTFYLAACVFGLLFLANFILLPRTQTDTAKQVVSISTTFHTFATFFRKPQVVPALLFMLLYRLPEALLVKICPLFLLDSPSHGGLGLTTGDLGLVQGTIGVIGLTLGGIIGGFCIAEMGGLKRWLWPMVLSITLPDAVYIALAYFQPEGIGALNVAVFIEQFGYGFGFTAYMVYLLYFARGPQSTAHYAFCTGFMALGMMLPGMVAGYLQEAVGYLNFFIIATVLTIVTFWVTTMISIDEEDEEAQSEA